MSVKVKNADGTWSQVGGMKKPGFQDITGSPNDNTNLKNALDAKQADIMSTISGAGGQYLRRKSDNTGLEFVTGGGGGGGVADVKVDGTSVVTGDIAEINGMEKVADRVSAFQTTPDDSHYPTEKLVKDSLDAIKFQASVVGTTLKIVSSACYVIGTKLYIGSLA